MPRSSCSTVFSGVLVSQSLVIRTSIPGPQRTATTFQYEVLCVSACLRWGAQSVTCDFLGNGGLPKHTRYYPGSVLKTHTTTHAMAIHQNHPNVALFTTLKAGDAIKRDSNPEVWKPYSRALSRAWGVEVHYVQLFESLGLRGHNIVYDYQLPLNLTDTQADALAEFIKYWEILRRCCGAQMSSDYRHRLFDRYPLDPANAWYTPRIPRGVEAWNESHIYKPHRSQSDPNFDSCEIYDIGEVERALMRTNVFQACSSLQQIRRISLADLDFDGRYCERSKERTIKFHLNPMDKSYTAEPIRSGAASWKPRGGRGHERHA